MNELSGSRVLVVGGAGFVGSNLCRKLLTLDVTNILVIDNLLSAEPENIPEDARIEFWQASIADDTVLNRIPDDYGYVFHLATYHGNQSSIHDPIADHDNNLITSIKLFNHLKRYRQLKKIVYSGAGCAVAKKTFDTADATEEGDTVSLEMDSPYSISKIVGEFYAVYYHRQHDLPVVRARFQNVYGPGEVLGAGRWRGTPATIWRNVTPTFIYKAIQHEALPLENEGIATRDFIYVGDIVDGLTCCAVNGIPGDVYNLASGQEVSIRELADRINRLVGNPIPPTIKPKRNWDRSGKRFGSTVKAEREIGFKASTPHEEGLKKTVDWTITNLPFIKKTIAKHDEAMRRIAAQ